MLDIDSVQLVCASCVPVISSEDFQNISVGDLVKIIRWQERFWVKILFIDEYNGNCLGQIYNYLCNGKGPQDGVIFNINEVIQVEVE